MAKQIQFNGTAFTAEEFPAYLLKDLWDVIEGAMSPAIRSAVADGLKTSARPGAVTPREFLAVYLTVATEDLVVVTS